MGFNIRELRTSDLDHLIENIASRRKHNEYGWVLQHADDPARFNAYVAVDDDDKVFGVIGYIVSDYVYNHRTVRGVIPMAWKIHDDYKGFAGVQLFKKVLDLGDFKFAIGGSDDAKELYKAFKLVYRQQIQQYYKVLKPVQYIRSSKKKWITDLGFLLYTLPSYLFGRGKSVTGASGRLVIEPYNPQTRYEFNNPFEEKVLTKKIGQDYLNWLLSCPVVEAEAFVVRYDQHCLGVAVCFLQTRRNVKRGRIVHVPYLGDDKTLWKELLNYLTGHFRSHACCYISVLGNSKFLKKALSDSWFINIPQKSRPLYIKDPSNTLEGIPVADWNIQFTEGDKSYRNF